ncbi:MAG TPA: hypothetical protein VKV39_05785 [Candidatus Sulfotelmatobacter sp.]|nr:hypothetical protein [Candidatus Sulfotelmatobacter sp.]
MKRFGASVGFLVLLFTAASYAQNGPCASPSGKLACVLPQEYGIGSGGAFNFTTVLYDAQAGPNAKNFHPQHFGSDFSSLLGPLTGDIARQANLLPIASPSSGVLLTYDTSLKTFVVSTDSLGPILGERGDTIGRHKLFVGFSYQYFNFDKIDGVNMRSIPAMLVHRDDNQDDTPLNTTPTVTCSAAQKSTAAQNLGGCAFVRDLINTQNSIALKVNQYTAYVTFGLTKKIDISAVVPFETVRMSLYSQDTIIPGSDGSFAPTANSPDATILNQNVTDSHGAPLFLHLFKDCVNTSPAGGVADLAAPCTQHTFPDPTWIGTSFTSNGTTVTGTPGTPNGSNAINSASGIGDVVARVKWNAVSGEHLRVAGGADVRLPTGDALNFLGSGSYGVKPFAVLSYRARVSPHVLVGYEWNSQSILSSRQSTVTTATGPSQEIGLASNRKGYMPSDFVYSAGADTWITKWLTAAVDIVGARYFRGGTESVTSQPFLAPCTSGCTAEPATPTVSYNSLNPNFNASYSITNLSAGAKIRPIPKSKLVITGNVIVRLDNGGLHAKPAPLAGIGYTF